MLKHGSTRIFFISALILLWIGSYFFKVSGWFFLIAIFAWLAITIYGSAFIGSGYHIKAFCSNPDAEKKIALTFDDGPSPNTLKVLAVLRKYGAKATFFCIGKQIEKYPEILGEIVNNGHTIGNHSFSHSPNFDWFGTNRVTAEIRAADALIENATGKKSTLFRPPYGVTNPSIRRALELTGHRVIGWSIRSMDGISKNESYILNRIKRRLKSGAVILLHDDREHTAAVLERFLQEASAKNFEFVTIESLMRDI